MDVNCAKFIQGVCQNCSKGFYPGSNGLCKQFNPLCKTSDIQTGACKTCYPGYTLIAGLCEIGSSSTSNSDPNCKSTNTFGVCTSCYASFYLSAQATCIRLDPLCKSYTPSQRDCSDCYDGYTLVDGKCIISTKVPSANDDPYCIKSQGSNCLNCASGYFKDHTGACKELNPLCK